MRAGSPTLRVEHTPKNMDVKSLLKDRRRGSHPDEKKREEQE